MPHALLPHALLPRRIATNDILTPGILAAVILERGIPTPGFLASQARFSSLAPRHAIREIATRGGALGTAGRFQMHDRPLLRAEALRIAAQNRLRIGAGPVGLVSDGLDHMPNLAVTGAHCIHEVTARPLDRLVTDGFDRGG